MRLIDADDFFERMKNDTDLCAEMEKYGEKALKKYLDLQPTAYDIDKVVTELNELDVTAIKRYEGGTFGNYEGTDYYIKKSDAIKIVKLGGMDDDVCEWHCDVYEIWHTKCHILADNEPLEYTYCPYCGNKIKVVD